MDRRSFIEALAALPLLGFLFTDTGADQEQLSEAIEETKPGHLNYSGFETGVEDSWNGNDQPDVLLRSDGSPSTYQPDRSGRDLSGRMPAARYLRVKGMRATKNLDREPEFDAAGEQNIRGPLGRARPLGNPLFTYQRRGLRIDGTCNWLFVQRVQEIYQDKGKRAVEAYILSFAREEVLDGIATAHI